jgi:hypothetical protein
MRELFKTAAACTNLVQPSSKPKFGESATMTIMTPLQCVELQFEAYNQRDLPRFLSAFADDVRSVRLPDMTLLLDGKAAYGDFYATQRFVHDGLRAELLSRVVIGNKVIDHELIHGLGPEPIETGIMFVVENGLIRTVFAIPAKSPS